jgi:hypothetical protein
LKDGAATSEDIDAAQKPSSELDDYASRRLSQENRLAILQVSGNRQQIDIDAALRAAGDGGSRWAIYGEVGLP